MKLKIEPFLMKKGNRVAKAAIEFDESDSLLNGFHLVGFTICEDEQKGLFVLFPASMRKDEKTGNKTFFFLRPNNDEQIGELENKILDEYDKMMNFNNPVMK